MGIRSQLQVIRDLQRDERGEFVTLLLDLDPDDWNRPTPCVGWSVADVASHVLAWEHLLTGPTFRMRALRSLRLLLLHLAGR